MSSHIGENFKNFGPTAFTETGINESFHRGIKLAYMATNKKKTGLGQQILQVNLPADLLCSSSIRSFARKNRSFMTTTRELSAEDVEALRPMDCNELHKQNMAAALAQRYVLQMQERNPGCSIEEQFESLESAKSGIYSRGFEIYKTATIAARLPWTEHKAVTVKQIIYGSDALESWGSRNDGVLYEGRADNIQTREYQEAFKSVGIVRGFLRLRKDPSNAPSVVVLRALQTAATQPGNTKMVTEYGYRRFKYKLYGGDAQLVCLPGLCIGSFYPLVQDLYEVLCRKDEKGSDVHFHKITVNDLPANPSERKQSHFIHVPNFQISAIGEDDLQQSSEDQDELPTGSDILDLIVLENERVED